MCQEEWETLASVTTLRWARSASRTPLAVRWSGRARTVARRCAPRGWLHGRPIGLMRSGRPLPVRRPRLRCMHEAPPLLAPRRVAAENAARKKFHSWAKNQPRHVTPASKSGPAAGRSSLLGSLTLLEPPPKHKRAGSRARRCLRRKPPSSLRSALASARRRTSACRSTRGRVRNRSAGTPVRAAARLTAASTSGRSET
jgi:hypothetical protein